jgi:hypothetical protein
MSALRTPTSHPAPDGFLAGGDRLRNIGDIQEYLNDVVLNVKEACYKRQKAGRDSFVGDHHVDSCRR